VLDGGHIGQVGAVVRHDVSAAAGVDDHQEPTAAKIGEGVCVVQDLQAAAGPEFEVSAPERDQVPDGVQERVAVGALGGDGGALRVRVDRQVEDCGRGSRKSRAGAWLPFMGVRDPARL
jgi:hypothetical protein